jgi:VWFA-related protein
MDFGRYITSSAKSAIVLVFVLVLAIGSVATAALVAEDASIPTYRGSASEVRVTFFTTDAANHPVKTISRDDFAIVDGDQVVRDFRSLARSEESKLEVGILIDASASMAMRLRAAVRDVLDLLSQDQAGAVNGISVISFSGLQTAVLCDRDCRSQKTQQRLLSLQASGTTPLFDAVAFAADFLSQRKSPESRPVLILFSDGDDSISKISMRDALQSVTAAGALLYAVELSKNDVEKNTRRYATRSSDRRMRLQEMAGATGGRYIAEGDSRAYLLQEVFNDLRASYVVTYQAPEARPGFRSLRILPKHDLNLRFHCRNGYDNQATVR